MPPWPLGKGVAPMSVGLPGHRLLSSFERLRRQRRRKTKSNSPSATTPIKLPTTDPATMAPLVFSESMSEPVNVDEAVYASSVGSDALGRIEVAKDELDAKEGVVDDDATEGRVRDDVEMVGGGSRSGVLVGEDLSRRAISFGF